MTVALALPRSRPVASMSVPRLRGRGLLAPGPLLVLAGALFNFALCLADTRHVLHVTSAVAALCELVILGIGLLVIRHRLSARSLAVAGLCIGSLFGIKLINPALDLKILHDLLVMYVFYVLGTTSDTDQADRLVWLLMVVVLVVGLAELLLPAFYGSLFDVWTFYVDKGVIDPGTINYGGTTAFVSGSRGGTLSRTLFPSLLGPTRVSSIFLEPVSLGNFSVIVFAWCLSTWRRFSLGWLTMVASAAVCMVLGDSRFAAASWILLLALRLTGLFRPRLVVFCLPVLCMLGLLIAGSVYELPGVKPSILSDDFPGRLLFSGRLLNDWGLPQWLALSPSRVYTSDTGYAYLINNLGLPLSLLFLLLFACNKVATDREASMKAMVALFAATSLCIGANMFTIKTAGLLWFLYGSTTVPLRPAIGVGRPRHRSKPDPRRQVQPSPTGPWLRPPLHATGDAAADGRRQGRDTWSAT